ncbi:hypothetical protein HK099_002631 [Clydaea vesicula]|uniref:Uncharacterized protein n=1 Tax=Clydaea vesicula TaxID=447962 RepID=A0AAD5XUJ1_9FUNG|nr:hypothetical protein HK099_002631 [Clydaea vesicula]
MQQFVENIHIKSNEAKKKKLSDLEMMRSMQSGLNDSSSSVGQSGGDKQQSFYQSQPETKESLELKQKNQQKAREFAQKELLRKEKESIGSAGEWETVESKEKKVVEEFDDDEDETTLNGLRKKKKDFLFLEKEFKNSDREELEIDLILKDGNKEKEEEKVVFKKKVSKVRNFRKK